MITDPHAHERVKAGFHLAMLGLAGTFAWYNGKAWLRRRQHHLAINFVLYGALVGIEAVQVAGHLLDGMKEDTND